MCTLWSLSPSSMGTIVAPSIRPIELEHGPKNNPHPTTTSRGLLWTFDDDDVTTRCTTDDLFSADDDPAAVPRCVEFPCPVGGGRRRRTSYLPKWRHPAKSMFVLTPSLRENQNDTSSLIYKTDVLYLYNIYILFC